MGGRAEKHPVDVPASRGGCAGRMTNPSPATAMLVVVAVHATLIQQRPKPSRE